MTDRITDAMRRRVPIWSEFVCRQCAIPGAGRFSFSVPKRQIMYRDAMKTGWRFQYDEAFCCQRCLEAFQKEQGLRPS